MKKINLLIIALILIVQAKVFANRFDHSTFDQILQTHVNNGLVDYKALKSDKNNLDSYLQQLEQVNQHEFKTWSREEKMAYWINAYNAITIEGILRNYPIEWGGLLSRMRFPKNSIRQIGKFWDTAFIKTAGKDHTLNEIEHEILRKKFDDPRIHFVIVCASIGCPTLENRAFFAENLDQRLDQASKDFIKDREKVRLDEEENILYLSSIFDWYKEDFKRTENSDKTLKDYKKKERGIIEFILKYIGETEKNYILKNQPEIKYLDYDWSLNEQK